MDSKETRFTFVNTRLPTIIWDVEEILVSTLGSRTPVKEVVV